MDYHWNFNSGVYMKKIYYLISVFLDSHDKKTDFLDM